MKTLPIIVASVALAFTSSYSEDWDNWLNQRQIQRELQQQQFNDQLRQQEILQEMRWQEQRQQQRERESDYRYFQFEE